MIKSHLQMVMKIFHFVVNEGAIDMGNVAGRVYGAKARMALMVPSTNTVAAVSYTHLTLPTSDLV